MINSNLSILISYFDTKAVVDKTLMKILSKNEPVKNFV